MANLKERAEVFIEKWGRVETHILSQSQSAASFRLDPARPIVA